MSPNDRPHVYISWNPEAGTRTPCWVIRPRPRPEPVYIGVIGFTWME